MVVVHRVEDAEGSMEDLVVSQVAPPVLGAGGAGREGGGEG
jgi:hypothetical protein